MARVLPLVLSLALAAPALAAPALADEALRSALASLPAAAAEAPGVEIAGYLVPAAVSDDPRQAAMMPMGRGVKGLVRDPAAWSAANGLDAAALRWVVAWGTPESHVTGIGLSPEGMAALPAALQAAGFDLRDDGLMQNGDPFAADFKARDLAGLWRDHLGRAAILALDAEGLRVAQRAEDLRAAAPSPLVAMVLDGLDAVAPGARVRQAALVGPEAGMQTDPGVVLSDPGDSAIPGAAAEGIAPWRLALLADIGDGLVQVTLHADCATAEAALAATSALWADIGAAPRSGTALPLEGACAAALVVDGAVYRDMLGRLAVRDFLPLRFGG